MRRMGGRGDCNNSPEVITSSGFAEQAKGQVIATGPGAPTCVTATSASVIGYFVLGRLFAIAANRVRVVSAALAPHRTVELTLELKARKLM